MTILSRQSSTGPDFQSLPSAGLTANRNVELLDVLLVLRSCAEHYPPTLNQANMLAAAGLRVGLIDLTADGTSEALGCSFRRYRVHRMWNSKLEAPYPRSKRWMNWLRFHRACRNVVRQAQPRVVIAYDTLACVFAKPKADRHRTVYHFHELPEPEKGEGWGPRIWRARAAQFSRQADLVAFSDAERARLYKEEAGLSELPKVVMNCPLRIETVPASPLMKLLEEHGKSAMKTVCYLGSIGRDQGIVEATASMRFWPPDALLVLIGPYSEQMKAIILNAAGESGTAGRVIFLGPRPHGEALALAAAACIGISLIQPNTRNWLYSAGAINKRFEYMAIGLAQVTNNSPGVADIVERNQCGLCVDPTQPEAIGRAVLQLLDDSEQRRVFSANARSCHLDRFNYECQFRTVLEWITGAVKEDERS